MSAPREDYYLACVDLTCDRLDRIEEYSIYEGDAVGPLVLHGLAMYARDTARAAALLLRADQNLAAAALSRVVLEHGVLAQWIGADPEVRGRLFMQQGYVERTRWMEVVAAAYPRREGMNEQGASKKSVAPELSTLKRLFGESEDGRSLYLTYRNLSRCVHPSVETVSRYTTATNLPGGSLLKTQLQLDRDSEGTAYFLACALVLSALPYLDVLGQEGAAAAIRAAAGSAGVFTRLDAT